MILAEAMLGMIAPYPMVTPFSRKREKDMPDR